MKVQLIRGTRQFSHIQAARQYMKSYLKDHQGCYFVICGKNGETMLATATDFMFNQSFDDVVRFCIQTNATSARVLKPE